MKMWKAFIICELLTIILANIYEEAKHFHDKNIPIDSRKYLENIYNYYLTGNRKDLTIRELNNRSGTNCMSNGKHCCY